MSDTVMLAVKVTNDLFPIDERFVWGVSCICVVFPSLRLITRLEKCHSGMTNVLFLIVL